MRDEMICEGKQLAQWYILLNASSASLQVFHKESSKADHTPQKLYIFFEAKQEGRTPTVRFIKTRV
jgi:hypothetical protein